MEEEKALIKDTNSTVAVKYLRESQKKSSNLRKRKTGPLKHNSNLINSLLTLLIFLALSKGCHSYSNIKLIVYGEGMSNVFSSEGSITKPDEVYINEIKQDLIKSEYMLENSENNIELVWYSPATSTFNMFKGCSKIKEINFTNFDSSKVTNAQSMLHGCTSLIKLDFTNFDTSYIIDMSYMFFNCNSLKSLNITNFNTDKVIYMNSMFYNCSKLSKLNLNNFKTLQVKSMNRMFYNCLYLSSLDLSNF